MRSFAFVVVALLACSGDSTVSDAGAPDGGLPLAPVAIRTRTYAGGFRWQAGNAAVVAVRSGDGPWRTIYGVSGTYELVPTEERYSVAIICREPGVQIYAVSATRSELDAVEYDCPAIVSEPYYFLYVSVIGLPEGDRADVWYGPDSQTTNRSGTLRLVGSSDARDLVVVRGVDEGERKVFPAHLFLRRAITLSERERNIPVDVVRDGFGLGSEAVTFGRSDPRYDVDLFTAVAWITAGGARVPMNGVADGGSRYATLPAGQATAGDWYRAEISAQSEGPAGGRRTWRWFQQPAPVEVSLPEPLAVPVVARSGVRSLLKATFEPHADAVFYTLRTSSTGATVDDDRSWTTIASKGWLRGSTVIEQPDLSGILDYGLWFEHGADARVTWRVLGSSTKHEGEQVVARYAWREGTFPD